jgi:hypothetical protein
MRGLICRKHQKYDGTSEPKVDCVECWVIYLRSVFVKLNEVIEYQGDLKLKGGKI